MALSLFQSQFPHVGLVLLVEETQNPFTLFRLGKSGVRHLIFLPGEDLPNILVKTLARAGQKSATSIVIRTLSRFLPRRELRAVHLAMDSVHRRLSAEDLAGAMGFSRPHLSERFKAVGLPSTGHFLLWTRLFHAGHWLQEPGRTGESVGRQLDYSSGAAFRRALKLYTGATPTQVRQGGGLSLVLGHFLSRTGLPPLQRFSA